MPDNRPPIDPFLRFNSLAHRARNPSIQGMQRPTPPTKEESRAAALGPWLSGQECETVLLPYLTEKVKLANDRSRQTVGQNDAIHYFESGYEAACRDFLDQIRAWRSGNSLTDPDGTLEE